MDLDVGPRFLHRGDDLGAAGTYLDKTQTKTSTFLIVIPKYNIFPECFSDKFSFDSLAMAG
jgi:hypothetical protein